MHTTEAAEFLQANYGLTGVITPLDGERDDNFRVECDQKTYVLKFSSQAERSHLEFQNVLLSHLEASFTHQLPQIILSNEGQDIIDVNDTTCARLLTWIDGDMWSTLQAPDIRAKRSLGRHVALLDRALFPCVKFEQARVLERDFGWNVLQSSELLEHISKIDDPHIQAIVQAILNDTVTRTIPVLNSLAQGVIHNDANDNNIVVRGNDVVALIDFGDLIIAPRIAGLAVACAYALGDAQEPMRDILPIVSGYHATWPLTETELDVLFPLIKARIATSIVMAAIQSSQDPTNEYLLISQVAFRKLIQVLAQTSESHTLFRIRAACGYEASPTSFEVRNWLQSGEPTIADVVAPPLAQAKKIWFDWSVDGGDSPTTSAEIDAAMAQAGAVIAIGHYCEDRNVYSGDSYQVTQVSRRTVHLGVDLFAPAGTPVYAALDGTVALFNDNATHLDYGPVIVLEHHTSAGTPFWTLYGHLSRPSLEPLFVGKVIKAGEQIATMGEEFENVGWAPHTHFQLLTSLVDMGVDVYGVAPLDELPMWRSISPNPNLILRIAEGTDAHAKLPTPLLISERATVMSPALSLNFQEPLHITRGSGTYLFDVAGRPYLDLVNNVAHVGHCNPRVVAAGTQQMALLNTNTRFINQHAIEYARNLASTLPDPLSVVFFVNSGSEANDLALRLAQAHTRAKGMLVLEHAYHGHVSSIIDVSPYKFLGKGGQGKPEHVEVVPIPDSYKGKHRGAQAGAQYVAELQASLDRLQQPLCAFISEAIVSTAGQITLAPGFLTAAYDIVRKAGGVCIADEVQIGLGRIGEHFWGFQLHNVIPDIVTMGKPIGNGHPLAAVVTTPEVAASFLNGMEYFNTFGGNPVSTAIGQSVLDVIHDGGLQAHARAMGNYLMNEVRALGNQHESIGDVRGSGLFIGVELVEEGSDAAPATTLTRNLMQFAKERGVMLSSDGPGDNVLKIKPPLVISATEIDLFLTVLDEGLSAAKTLR